MKPDGGSKPAQASVSGDGGLVLLCRLTALIALISSVVVVVATRVDMALEERKF